MAPPPPSSSASASRPELMHARTQLAPVADVLAACRTSGLTFGASRALVSALAASASLRPLADALQAAPELREAAATAMLEAQLKSLQLVASKYPALLSDANAAFVGAQRPSIVNPPASANGASSSANGAPVLLSVLTMNGVTSATERALVQLRQLVARAASLSSSAGAAAMHPDRLDDLKVNARLRHEVALDVLAYQFKFSTLTPDALGVTVLEDDFAQPKRKAAGSKAGAGGSVQEDEKEKKKPRKGQK